MRERLCGGTGAVDAAERSTACRVTLTDAKARAMQAFLAPLLEAKARLSDLRQRQREGLGDLLVLGDAIASAEAEIQPYRRRVTRIDGAGRRRARGRSPARSSGCEATLAEAAARARPAIATSRARMRCCCSAPRSTGIPRRRRWPSAATLAATARRQRAVRAPARPGRCAAAASALMADARAAPVGVAKNDAMRALLRHGGLAVGGVGARGARAAPV